MNSEHPGFSFPARAALETVLALAAAFLLTVVGTLPWLPVASDVWVDLHPAAGTASASTEDLSRRVVEQGVADQARVILHEGVSRLELSGVPELSTKLPPAELEARLAQLNASLTGPLVGSGFQPREAVVHPSIDLPRLLHAEGGALPALLSVQAAAFLILGWLLARWRIRATPSAPVARVGRALGIGVLCGIAALAFSATLAWLLQLVGLPVEEQDWLTELYGDPSAVARLAPWLVLVGPLSEEVFFRGFAFRYIRQEAGVPAGILISSALFAAIHFNLSGFLVYLAIGCTLAFAQQRTNHLLAPVAGHVVLNGVVLLASGWFGGPQVGP